MAGSLGPLVIRSPHRDLSNVWQVGYTVRDVFRPFAGGTSQRSLDAVIAAEQRLTPGLVVEDRR